MNVEGWEMDLSLDLTETGLQMFFKPYQIEALDLLWKNNKYTSSREVWEKVNQTLPGTISRASIFNFLNASVENGLLDYEETTGKGGYRRLYSAKFSRVEIKSFLSKKIQKHLQTLP